MIYAVNYKFVLNILIWIPYIIEKKNIVEVNIPTA